MAVKPFNIDQLVMMSEEGIKNHGEKYRNTIFKIVDVCPIGFNFIGRKTKPIIAEHLNDLVEIKNGEEDEYLFPMPLYDSDLTDRTEFYISKDILEDNR